MQDFIRELEESDKETLKEIHKELLVHSPEEKKNFREIQKMNFFNFTSSFEKDKVLPSQRILEKHHNLLFSQLPELDNQCVFDLMIKNYYLSQMLAETVSFSLHKIFDSIKFVSTFVFFPKIKKEKNLTDWEFLKREFENESIPATKEEMTLLKVLVNHFDFSNENVFPKKIYSKDEFPVEYKNALFVILCSSSLVFLNKNVFDEIELRKFLSNKVLQSQSDPDSIYYEDLSLYINRNSNKSKSEQVKQEIVELLEKTKKYNKK